MSEKVDKDTKEHYRDSHNHDNDDDNVPVTVNNQDNDDEDSEREKNSVHSSDEDDDVPDSSELESVREYLAAKLGIRDLKFLDDNQRHPQVRFT